MNRTLRVLTFLGIEYIIINVIYGVIVGQMLFRIIQGTITRQEVMDITVTITIIMIVYTTTYNYIKERISKKLYEQLREEVNGRRKETDNDKKEK